METNEMCFVYIPPEQRSYLNEDCRALSGYCPGFDACPFYKSNEQHEADRQAANMRLRALPLERQTHIALKYYHGKTPWRDEGDEHKEG